MFALHRDCGVGDTAVRLGAPTAAHQRTAEDMADITVALGSLFRYLEMLLLHVFYLGYINFSCALDFHKKQETLCCPDLVFRV